MSKISICILVLLMSVQANAHPLPAYWSFVHSETGFTFELDEKARSVSVGDEVFKAEFCNDNSNLNCFSVRKFNLYVAFPKDMSTKKYTSWVSYGKVYCVVSAKFDQKTSDVIYVINSIAGRVCNAGVPEQVMVVSQKRGLIFVRSTVEKWSNSFVSIDSQGFGSNNRDL